VPAPSGATPGSAFGAIVDRLTKWIPGDTLAIYVPGVTAIAASSGKPSVLLLVVMIVVTPLFVLGAAFSARHSIDRAVLTSAVLAAIAFTIWSLSVPLSGWQKLSWISENDGSVAIGAAILGVLFGQLAEGIVNRSAD
jgi:hypothetical protein